jgi:hypothetical protein
VDGGEIARRDHHVRRTSRLDQEPSLLDVAVEVAEGEQLHGRDRRWALEPGERA